jgi:hypothetical protein
MVYLFIESDMYMVSGVSVQVSVRLPFLPETRHLKPRTSYET